MNVLEHLNQHPIYRINLLGIDLSITDGVITLWAAVLVTFIFYYFASRRMSIIPKRLQNIAELIILFIRDEVASEIQENRDKWLPFLITLFSFILMSNLIALIPGFSGVTSDINTTAALALMVFIIVQAAGIYKHGIIGYLKSIVPQDLPLPMVIFMIPIEIVSQLAKPFSLALRLFANMFAGHAMMLILLSLIFVFKSYLILPLPLIGNILFLSFEVFISFIQAFIFTYLTSLYIATAIEGH